MLDIWTYIGGFIKKDNEKCHLLMTSKEMGQCKIFFYEMVKVKKIIKSQWYDHFFNVYVDSTYYPLPKYVTHITINKNRHKSKAFRIPSTVIYLNFGDQCWEPIVENTIPSSVKHLTVGSCYRTFILKYIPSSVTHLKLPSMVVNDPVPSSITHLELFRCGNSNNIPTSIKYLKINTWFNHTNLGIIKNSVTELDLHVHFFHFYFSQIPFSVEKLTLNGTHYIKEMLPSSITKITFDSVKKYPYKSFTNMECAQQKSSVKHLVLRGEFPHAIEKFIPDSVTEIEHIGLYDKPMIAYLNKYFRRRNVKLSFN